MRGAAGLHARGRVTGKADLGGSAWEETYAINCKERVRRTFLLFLSVKEGMKHSELAPGDTIADAILQRDFLQGATAAAMSRARAGCKGAQVRNTRVTSTTGASQPWTEVWSMDACGTLVDINVTFSPSPKGGIDWSIFLTAPAPPLISNPIRAGLTQNERQR